MLTMIVSRLKSIIGIAKDLSGRLSKWAVLFFVLSM